MNEQLSSATPLPAERVKRIFDNAVGADLSSWEKFEFLPSIKGRFVLTEKQEKCLRSIERRVIRRMNE